jgi:hypothetical protein
LTCWVAGTDLSTLGHRASILTVCKARTCAPRPTWWLLWISAVSRSVVPPALSAGKNRLVHVLDIEWSSPESGGWQYESRRLKWTIGPRSKDWWSEAMLSRCEDRVLDGPASGEKGPAFCRWVLRGCVFLQVRNPWRHLRCGGLYLRVTPVRHGCGARDGGMTFSKLHTGS